MNDATGVILMALLATLEERARKNGEKSVLKGVISRLVDSGADETLIAEIAALRPKKAPPAPKVAAKAKPPAKPSRKAKPDADTEAKSSDLSPVS